MSSPVTVMADMSVEECQERRAVIQKKKKKLKEKLIRVSQEIRAVQDAKLSDRDPQSLYLPPWDELSPAPFSSTEGAFNLLKEYPRLNSWVKSKTDAAVAKFINTRDKDYQYLLSKLNRIKYRILAGISSIMERRRCSFSSAKLFKKFKYNNRRAVGWRYVTATRRLSHIDSTSTVGAIQAAVNDLVTVRDMDRSF